MRHLSDNIKHLIMYFMRKFISIIAFRKPEIAVYKKLEVQSMQRSNDAGFIRFRPREIPTTHYQGKKRTEFDKICRVKIQLHGHTFSYRVSSLFHTIGS